MNIKRLDHVNVRTKKLNEMINWYTDILGMSSGQRPNFPFPGAWMYAGTLPMVHLVGIDDTNDEQSAGSDVALKLEHFAFAASHREKFELHLKAKGVKYRRSELTEASLIQINVWDPDGNHIHIDFPSTE